MSESASVVVGLGRVWVESRRREQGRLPSDAAETNFLCIENLFATHEKFISDAEKKYFSCIENLFRRFAAAVARNSPKKGLSRRVFVLRFFLLPLHPLFEKKQLRFNF